MIDSFVIFVFLTQNLISLHEFQKLELEKKKAARFSKLIRTGPQILFHSMTMPIVELEVIICFLDATAHLFKRSCPSVRRSRATFE